MCTGSNMYVVNGMHIIWHMEVMTYGHASCDASKERGHVVTREWEDRTLKRDSFGSSLSLPPSDQNLIRSTAENCSVKTQKIGSQPSFCVKNTSLR